MTFQQELSSWFSPKSSSTPLAPSTPKINSPAPPLIPSTSSSTTTILHPSTPTIIVFLRHCGCPFAERTFLHLRTLAHSNPNLDFIAISHSDEIATKNWLKSLPADDNSSPSSTNLPRNLRLEVDDDLRAYATWGLGTSGFLHALSPLSLYQVYRLGKDKNIWNRPTESGSRWQQGGAFAVDGEGKVVWGRGDSRADDGPDLDAAVKVAKGEGEGASAKL